MYSKNRIGNRKFHSKLPIIVFQINSISLNESEEFGETLIGLIWRWQVYCDLMQNLGTPRVHNLSQCRVGRKKIETHLGPPQ